MTILITMLLPQERTFSAVQRGSFPSSWGWRWSESPRASAWPPWGAAGKREESKGDGTAGRSFVSPPYIFLTEPLGHGEVVVWSNALWMLYCAWNIKLLHKRFKLWNVKLLACIIFVKWGCVSGVFQHGFFPLSSTGEKVPRRKPKPSEARLCSVSKAVGNHPKKKHLKRELTES